MNDERALAPVEWTSVRFESGFWKTRQDTIRTVTLKAEYEQLRRTHRLESLELNWKPELPWKPHHYWDSDVAKWIEAAAYTLAVQPDRELRDEVEAAIDLIAKTQHADGYINTYFSSMEPGKRWTNVYVMHELYCAGHLLEAAVAHHKATGSRKFLDVMRRYIDCIDRRFGPEPDKLHGYPGHEELELALVKLYRVSGEQRYLKLAKYFVDERGRRPLFFEQEAAARGENPDKSPLREILNRNFLPVGPYALFQSHLPVREQKTAEGHAVRAMYLYSGMADLAAETGDESLAEACRTLWRSVTGRRMSITGGVGPHELGERFTFDYDLPNDSAYNETCAAIGLVFWAHRMLQLERRGEYADIIEQTLYNGVLSGISLGGDLFFYSNHLEICPELYANGVSRNVRMLPQRQSWFEVSCCPPNLARLIASLGGYVYSTQADGLYVHLYTQNNAAIETAAGRVSIRQSTNYPWEGGVSLAVDPEKPSAFKLFLRIPGWCERFKVKINGSPHRTDPGMTARGYLCLERSWKPGDLVELQMDMPVRRVEAHPAVRMDCGRAAIMRGPLVYCLEETDNGGELTDLVMPLGAALEVRFEKDLLGGVAVIRGRGYSRDVDDWKDALYRPAGGKVKERAIAAVPYYSFANRGVGEMVVWVRY